MSGGIFNPKVLDWLHELPSIGTVRFGSPIALAEWSMEVIAQEKAMMHRVLGAIDGLELLGVFAVHQDRGTVLLLFTHPSFPPMRLGEWMAKVMFIVTTGRDGEVIHMEMVPTRGKPPTPPVVGP